MNTVARATSDEERDQLALRALTLATRTAVAMLGPGDEAREAAHDVVVRVLERRAQLRDPYKFDAWVHRIAARETLDVQRRRRRRRSAEHQLDERHEEVSTADVDLAETIAFSDAARAALVS
jgi:DNA-directed RNA polymerase specialized sigma24 family protein